MSANKLVESTIAAAVSPVQVAVVGSVNIDAVFRVPAAPGAGETVDGARCTQMLGGKGANQAVSARRFGATVSLIAALGEDDNGAAARKWLRNAGVDQDWVHTRPGAATGTAAIVVEASGENRIVVANSANALLDPQHVLAALSAVDPSGVAISAEVPAAACGDAARWARERGLPAVYNAAPARALDEKIIEAAPLLVVNAGEAARLADADTPEAAAQHLASRTGGAVVVTLGARGALIADARGLARIPGVAVTAADTTGAGDAFCGVLTAELARDKPLPAAVATANDTAARLVTTGRHPVSA